MASNSRRIIEIENSPTSRDRVYRAQIFREFPSNESFDRDRGREREDILAYARAHIIRDEFVIAARDSGIRED